MTVNYIKKHDINGFYCKETIKISKDHFEGFNEYITEIRKPIEKKHVKTGVEMEILMYLRKITDLKACLTNTQLLYLISFLRSKNVDTSRILTGRNALLEVV